MATPDAARGGTETPSKTALLRDLSMAAGRAQGAVDVAQGEAGHAARQIVFALAYGGDTHPALGLEPLRTMAIESERLSGKASTLGALVNEGQGVAKLADDLWNEATIRSVIDSLDEQHDDAMSVARAAQALRRRLPREYGDPLVLDRDWPAVDAGEHEESA